MCRWLGFPQAVINKSKLRNKSTCRMFWSSGVGRLLSAVVNSNLSSRISLTLWDSMHQWFISTDAWSCSLRYPEEDTCLDCLVSLPHNYKNEEQECPCNGWNVPDRKTTLGSGHCLLEWSYVRGSVALLKVFSKWIIALIKGSFLFKMLRHMWIQILPEPTKLPDLLTS